MAIQFLTKVFLQLKQTWKKFVLEVKSKTDQDDKAQIFLSDLVDTLKKYNIKFSSKEIDNFADSFPGRNQGSRVRVNI